jgi:hypothetical protein
VPIGGRGEKKALHSVFSITRLKPEKLASNKRNGRAG